MTDDTNLSAEDPDLLIKDGEDKASVREDGPQSTTDSSRDEDSKSEDSGSDQKETPASPVPEHYSPPHIEERKLNQGVRYYDFCGFMNRIEDDEGDFCIEALMTRPDWHEDVEAVQAKSDVPRPLPPGIRPYNPPPPPPPAIPGTRNIISSPKYHTAPGITMPPTARPPPTLMTQPPPTHVIQPPPTTMAQPPPPPMVNPPKPSLAASITYRGTAAFTRKDVNYYEYIHAKNLDLPSGSETPLEGRLMRVRLRSAAVLRALASCSDYNILHLKSAFEFQRPFRVFEEYHEAMKHKLAEMEEREDQTSTSETAVEQDEKQDEGQDGGQESGTQQHITNHRTAHSERSAIESPMKQPQTEENVENHSSSDPEDLQDLRCFIQFTEQMILPIRERFRNTDATSRLQICFEDIPYLFESGKLAFMPQQTKSSRGLHRSAAQQVWRMVSCVPAAVPSPYNEKDDDDEEDPCEFTQWSLYSLDHDGDNVVPVWKTVRFPRFKGERDITSLECYPLRFCADQAAIMEEHTKFGQLFTSCVTSSVRHHYYSGWTFIRGILAEPLEDNNGDPVHHPEHIESEVVIDFKEAIRSHPRWETELGSPIPNKRDWEYEDYADMPLRTWQRQRTTTGRRRFARDERNHIVTQEDPLYRLESDAWTEKDTLISGEVKILKNVQNDEDMVLLPKRIFAYVLRERKFARLEVSGIELNTGESVVTLDDIQMRDERRKMIRSAVSTHFRDRRGLSKLELDVIRGKGTGLVILLHGAPGVGKTATAEAVAAENKRPLFPITCGDLGFSPSAVDKSLRDIFRYAHLWNCVLLFDEADVFLTQRDRSGGNLERNALVGVFLRVLEYYSGILFLTTNRVGALDEAFQSRVHLSLCYPHLSLKDTIKILESNLSRLPREDKAEDRTALDGYLSVSDKLIKDFVTNEYKEYSERTGKKRGPWNGRQIRNAVQIAAGIAFYEKETEMEGKKPNGLPATLTAQHFREVAETTAEFEKYLKATKAADEEYLAHHRADRADNWDDEEENHPSYEGHSDDGGHYAPKRGSFRGNMRGRASSGRGRPRAGHEPSSNPDRSRYTTSYRSERGGSQYSTPARPSTGMRGRGQQHAPQDNRSRYPQEFHERYENEENPDDLQDEYADEEEYDQEYDDWGHTHSSPASHRGMKSPGSHAGKGRL